MFCLYFLRVKIIAGFGLSINNQRSTLSCVPFGVHPRGRASNANLGQQLFTCVWCVVGHSPQSTLTSHSVPHSYGMPLHTDTAESAEFFANKLEVISHQTRGDDLPHVAFLDLNRRLYFYIQRHF